MIAVVAVMAGVHVSVKARADIFQEPIPKYNLPLCYPPPSCPEVGTSALITMLKIDVPSYQLVEAFYVFFYSVGKRFCVKMNEI